MTEPYPSIAAITSAWAHPYTVGLWDADWMPVTVVGFQTESEAREFASLRPEPVIYLHSNVEHRSIACRVLVPHPDMPKENHVWRPKDDFPDERE